MSNGYPFVTKNEIAKRIASEPSFAIECVRLLDSGQRWMASHRPRAARLVTRLSAGAPTAEDLAEAIALAGCYARTLARLARDREIAESGPEVLARAAIFGVVRATALVAETVPASAPAPGIDTTATEVSAAPLKRRPGRPKGSRNRVREDQPPTKRRRRS